MLEQSGVQSTISLQECEADLSLQSQENKCMVANGFPKRQILDSLKWKQFPDNKFKFDENGRKLSKKVEHIVGSGEIARNELFLLFSHCFQQIFKLQIRKSKGLF